MDCNHCGKCCVNPIIALHNIPVNKDIKELGRWLSYHGCEPMKLHNGKEEVLAIRLKSACKNLKMKNGKSKCLIYGNRPQICRDYWCEKQKIQELMDKKAQELLGGAECSISSKNG